MPDSIVQEIKDRLDIIDVVSGYLKLEKTGINYRAPCPFHSEKKPSFFVSPSRQMFKCFGCGKSGSVFDFVMELEGIEFADALRVLAKKAGVALKEFKPELKTKRERLFEICNLSTSFFEKQLNSEKGKKVIDYLLKRGLKKESISKWRIGYSPLSWTSLSEFLISKGYNREEVVEAGLAVKKEGGGSYDRFRGRIIFPVFDLHSQVIGFGGRVFEKDNETAKYVNIQNTPLYDKSRVLYGLNFAKMDLRKKNECILTEGYLDVILSHQEGFENTVASSGTSLTPFQLKILKRYTPNLLTAFDMDSAGQIATKRGIEIAQKEGFDIKVIIMPKDKDPADVLSENPALWCELVSSSKNIMDFYFEDALNKFDASDPKGKKDISENLLPLIKRIPSKILQFHWAKRLAKALKVSEEAVLEELKNLVFRKEEREEEKPLILKPRFQMLEEKLLALCVKAPESTLCLVQKEDLNSFSGCFKTILASFQKHEVKCKKDAEKVCEKMEKKDESLKKVIDDCLFKSEIEEVEEVEKEFKVCLSSFRKLSAEQRMENLTSEIEKAEREGNEEKLENLLKTFSQLAKLK